MQLTLRDVKQALEYPDGPNAEEPTPGASADPSLLGKGEDNFLTPPSLTGKGAGGLGSSGVVFTGISTDTRTLKPGDLFVALRNAEIDGHQFIPQALRAGAAGLVVSQQVVASLDTPTLRVPDTEVAYGLLARHWRDRFDIPVIGVTGSVGKTTTKEMLVAALSPLGAILKTEASQNNETGVPKALLQLTTEHKAAVIEMGMRGSGQIAYLCGIARPTIGVITLIADNHLELLGSWDAIADAKGELLESLPADGLAVLNAEDSYLPYLRAKTAAQVVEYGGEDVHPVRLGSLPFPVREGLRMLLNPSLTGEGGEERDGRGFDGWQFTVRSVPVQIHTLSRHDISNALAALAVAEALGVKLADAADALKAYTPPPMRMQVIKTVNGVTILNDAYNAAPASVKSALETLISYDGGRKIAFLGDMRELGARADEAHRELGSVIDELGGLDALYTVGGLAAQIPNAAQRFADSEDAARFAREALTVQPGDVILVKGSRAMSMEKIVEALHGS